MATSTQTAETQQTTVDRISGEVRNETEGGMVPDGFEVALLGLRDGEITDQQVKTVNDNDRLFEFSNLDNDEGVEYRLAWEYEGVKDQIFIADQVTPENIEVIIYETTDSMEDIRVGAHATIIPSATGSDRIMGVLDLVTIRNEGDQTFKPDPSDPNFTGLNMIRFSLPEGFKELAVDSVLPQGQLLEINSGFAMTNPVPPGQHEILYSYAVNYSGNSLNFTRTLAFGADEVRVLIPPEYGNVLGDGMAVTRTTELGNTVYTEFAGNGYEPGFKMDFTVENLPQPGIFIRMNESLPGDNIVIFGLPIAIAAAMVGLVIYVLINNRRQKLSIALSPDAHSEILRQIINLDERLENGEIGADEHRNIRNVLTTKALGELEEEASDDETLSEDDPART